MKSPWPPVTVTGGPATSMRGPGIIPAAMRSRSASPVAPLEPTLRTVVKPAISVRSA